MNRPSVLHEDHRALAEAVRGYCRANCTEEIQRTPVTAFPNEFWIGLAGDLGVFAMAVPGEDPAAGGIVAACLELGAVAAPGPVAATFFAAHALPTAEAADVIDGRAIVAVGTPPLVPWAAVADVFIDRCGDDAWTARPAGAVEPVETLGGEPWARVRLARERPLARSAAAGRLADLATAGYLVGAGERMLDTAVEHARTREQFGRPIGSFQAVAHPLADASTGLESARRLTVVAANALDAKHPDGAGLAAGARLSASRAALSAAFTAHQAMGAIGYTIEGPLAHLTRRIRQLSLGAANSADLQHHVTTIFSREASTR
ncbi:acyl-CoA dehydrogenase family protein [Gordonia neofelifaecis]|uniref:Acyl-CoA dehydrogenase n=1 Tax=Gordonia neofelifaecis NRRL B-59395 TaxID=644548 RepID=F1YK33_9ACTN|nr:acyl-CoA dehydrogenase family protein [Gordonia neofelifaecis]EGD54879.1 acyl-CoA dehydrogenase [Gordonia neofelifaecis NRRL B-59395]